MSFGDDLRLFADKVEARVQDVFIGCTGEVQRSVVEGSEVTAAPGQPVDTGTLKGSWIGEFESADAWHTTTNVEYAPYIEEGVGMTLRSEVGGFHSVALTRGGWQKIVDTVRDEVVRDG